MYGVVTRFLTHLYWSKDMMVMRLNANPKKEQIVATPAMTEDSATLKTIVSFSLNTSWQLGQLAPSSQHAKFDGSSGITLLCTVDMAMMIVLRVC